MPQESEKAGPLQVWIARLQSRVKMLEQESIDARDLKKLLKEVDSCETYLKKLYVRAHDFLFPTAAGPHIALELAQIKNQLTTIRGALRRREPLHPLLWEQWPPVS